MGEAGKSGTVGNNVTFTVGQGAKATFNGGGSGGNAGGGDYPYGNYRGGSSGGGATDIRTVLGVWDNVDSLKSRIMVSGGSGGMQGNALLDADKGNAGGLSGQLGGVHGYLNPTYPQHIPMRGTGGTQMTGYSLGIGGPGNNSGSTGYCNGHSGGGGGYYGGTGGRQTGGSCHSMGGGGGSSFISGHVGCNAIDSSGSHTNQPNHYSGYIFINTQMIDGNSSMPAPKGGVQIGNSGDGFAKITFIRS